MHFAWKVLQKRWFRVQKQWGNIRTTTGSTHEIKLFAWRVLQKRWGARENAMKMITKIYDFLKKSSKRQSESKRVAWTVGEKWGFGIKIGWKSRRSANTAQIWKRGFRMEGIAKMKVYFFLKNEKIYAKVWKTHKTLKNELRLLQGKMPLSPARGGHIHEKWAFGVGESTICFSTIQEVSFRAAPFLCFLLGRRGHRFWWLLDYIWYAFLMVLWS